MDCLRRCCKPSREDRVRSEEIKRKMEANTNITSDIEEKQVKCYGHIIRMDDTRIRKGVCNKRSPGRKKKVKLKQTWFKGIQEAMATRNLGPENWNDRTIWNLESGKRGKSYI